MVPGKRCAESEPGFGTTPEAEGEFGAATAADGAFGTPGIAADSGADAVPSFGDDADESAGSGDTGLPGRPLPSRAREPLPTAQAEDPGWGSADAGWEAAEALVEQTRRAEETTTTAGLPKRVPKSNLLPGSAAQKPQPQTPRKPAAPRSPDAVRGRMSNFQQGIRRGRHAKAEPVSTEQPRSNPSRHEEQE